MHDTASRLAPRPSNNIADTIAGWATRRPHAVALRFLAPARAQEEISFAVLDARADAIAGRLLAFPAGSRALLLFKPGIGFTAALLACLRTGIIAVPLRMPSPRAAPQRIDAVLADCDPAVILTDSGGVPSFGAGRCPALEIGEIDQGGFGASVSRGGTDIALLQYTSGSTGDPKGVIVRHDNLASNIATLRRRLAIRRGSTTVSWLPHYHDMGLVGPILTALVSGNAANLMAPADFLRDPLSWLRAMSAYRADISMAPNFGYDLCARRLQDNPEALDPLEIDLSAWRVAIVGGEPVNAGTLARFAAAAAPLGFAARAFFPCYGLAEATLFVDGVQGPISRLARRFDPAALSRGRAVSTSAKAGKVLVACGERTAARDTVTVIADPATGGLAGDGNIGEICVSGPGIAAGYWRRLDETAERFGRRIAAEPGRDFFRTGDRGFFAEDLLFVTGRSDDVMIVNGLNHYPQDVEELASAAHPTLGRWRAAAFAVDGEEGVRTVVMQELARDARSTADPDALVAAIRQAVFEDQGLALDDVVLLAPGRLPITSSGKVRRGECRNLYQSGAVDKLRWPGASDRRATNRPAEVVPPAKHDRNAEAIEALRLIVGEVLSRPAARVDAQLPLSAFPVDSLKLVEILLLIEARLGQRLDPDRLLGANSLATLAGELSSLAAGERRLTASSFWADAALPADIVPPSAQNGGGDILITGASGLLGSHIVAELLERPGGAIHCLGRTPSPGNVARDAAAARRLAFAAADLTAADLGLGAADHAALADRVGTIIHCAADMDLVSPYARLRPLNVGGTRALLRFACTGRAKRILHVSSISVLETPLRAGRRLGESELLDFPETLAGGYAQSKWVSDVMVLRARERGVRASICRPPWILGDGALAAKASYGFLRRFLAACEQLGCVPDTPFRLNVVSVGYVARAIAALCCADHLDEPVYHLGAEQGIGTPAIAEILRRDKPGVALTAPELWMERLRGVLFAAEDHPLRPFASLFLGSDAAPGAAALYLKGRIPEMDSSRTGAVLRRLGVAAPPTAEAVRALIAGAWAGR